MLAGESVQRYAPERLSFPSKLPKTPPKRPGGRNPLGLLTKARSYAVISGGARARRGVDTVGTLCQSSLTRRTLRRHQVGNSRQCLIRN